MHAASMQHACSLDTTVCSLHAYGHVQAECRLHASLVGPRLYMHFYRASICEGGLRSRNSVRPSVCLSVRPSVTRVDCDETKWRTTDIFIPHERSITLPLWYQQCLVGDVPFPLKSAIKLTHPLRKTPTSTDFRSCLNRRRQRKKFNYDGYKVDHELSNEP